MPWEQALLMDQKTQIVAEYLRYTFHLPNSVTDTASVARPATNGSIGCPYQTVCEASDATSAK